MLRVLCMGRLRLLPMWRCPNAPWLLDGSMAAMLPAPPAAPGRSTLPRTAAASAQQQYSSSKQTCGSHATCGIAVQTSEQSQAE